MAVTAGPSGITGMLTRNGRLTRGGILFLRGFGLFILLGVAAEWRALTTAAFGSRMQGTVVQFVQIASDQDAYQVRVTFSPGGRTFEFDRTLRRPRINRGRAPLAEGDPVEVAYWPDAPQRPVLMHSHENWSGARWAWALGSLLVWLSWYWAPRPDASTAPR